MNYKPSVTQELHISKMHSPLTEAKMIARFRQNSKIVEANYTPAEQTVASTYRNLYKKRVQQPVDAMKKNDATEEEWKAFHKKANAEPHLFGVIPRSVTAALVLQTAPPMQPTLAASTSTVDVPALMSCQAVFMCVL
jgi:hypothetical protein